MKVSEIEKAFTVFFSLENGLSADRESGKRYLADVKQMFADQEAAKARLNKENPLIYEFYDLGMPDTAGDLAFGTSITYPGKIGDEYFMTKGHFHRILETAEVYFCFRGQGMMMMENPEGEWDFQRLSPGKAVYVPQRFAHRSINTGDTPFCTFFCFRADAGHDYKTIETKGFRKIVVDKNGEPTVVDNPGW